MTAVWFYFYSKRGLVDQIFVMCVNLELDSFSLLLCYWLFRAEKEDGWDRTVGGRPKLAAAL